MMKYVKAYRERDSQFEAELGLLESLRTKTHKNLVKMSFIEEKEGTVAPDSEQQMCIIHLKLEVYCNYYNFTLQKAIQKKKANGLLFPENELWYVLSTLLDVGRYLQEEGVSFGDYRSEDIFLTPEGYYIKLYLLNVHPGNP